MGNKPSSLPPPITIDQFKKAFDPKTNGLADSVEKTKNDIDNSNAKILNDIQKSNDSIGNKLQNNLASTKSALDNSLEKTRENVDMNKLQESVGIITKIASINPIVYFALEGVNASTGGKSNKYLNNSESTSNPLFNTISSVLGFGQENVKSLEPTLDFSKNVSELKPLPYTFDSQYDSKYSFLDTQQSTYTKSANNNETNNLQYIIPIVVGSGILIFIVSRKKV